MINNYLTVSLKNALRHKKEFTMKRKSIASNYDLQVDIEKNSLWNMIRKC